MKRKDMNQDSIDNYLWPNKYMLTFMGFWPLNSDASLCFRFFAYFRIIFSIIAISTLFIPEVLMLIVFWGDILVLTGKRIAYYSDTKKITIYQNIYIQFVLREYK